MTVAELIAILEKIEDKSIPVMVYTDITDFSGTVLYREAIEADGAEFQYGSPTGNQPSGILISEY